MIKQKKTQNVNKNIIIKNIDMLKKIVLFTSFILLILSIGNKLNAQKIYTVHYASDADVKVYVADYKSDADLAVYKVDYSSDADGNKGLWYFVHYKSDADKTVYFVDYKSDADLIIYFVDYKSDAGWRNSSKKYLMQ